MSTHEEEEKPDLTPPASEPGGSEPPALNPVQIEFVEDGVAFIKRVQESPDDGLHVLETSLGKFRIKELGQGETTQILIGQYRDSPDGNKLFELVKTVDRVQMMTIQQCVVDKDGNPIWKAANVLYMFNGTNQRKFRSFFDECLAGCLKYNPQLDISNPTTLQRLLRV